MGERCAAIDVGTNTVLLLVAERRGGRASCPVLERAEITRLGRGVDATGRLDPAAIRDTVAVLAALRRARRGRSARRSSPASRPAPRATPRTAPSSSRRPAPRRGSSPRSSPATRRPGSSGRARGATSARPGEPLAVLDVGGGSTELSFGDGPAPRGRASLQVGAVRLTERHVRGDPPSADELPRGSARRRARRVRPFAAMEAARPGGRLVGVAGTVTTLAAVVQALPRLRRGAGARLGPRARRHRDDSPRRLAALTVRGAGGAARDGAEARRRDPRRRDRRRRGDARHRLRRLTVSDRGVRWGLLYDRVA